MADNALFHDALSRFWSLDAGRQADILLRVGVTTAAAQAMLGRLEAQDSNAASLLRAHVALRIARRDQ